MAVMVALAIGAMHVAWTAVLRRQWVELFTTEPAVVRLAAVAMPIVGLCELGNWPQTTSCSAPRRGLQHQPLVLPRRLQERQGVLPLWNARNAHWWFCAPARRKS
jgi:hypothetical protein